MTKKRFVECEYFQYSDNTWILGYCTNPIRHKEINSVALMYCQGYACELGIKNKSDD